MSQLVAVGIEVVALVTEQGPGPVAGPTGAACNRRDAVNQGEGWASR
ncbi:hypothetical protein ACFWMX_12875 [Streptomyces sp. NPDC058378]